MRTQFFLILLSFVALNSCWWFPGEKCCPETDLGILCENSTAKTKPWCGPGKECCLRLDLAYDCCNEATEFCNPPAGGCVPKSQAPTGLIPVRIGIFSESLSFAIARTRYLWVQEGLNVTYVTVRSSTNQFELLKNKEVDFVATGIDNSINYGLNENNPIGGKLRTVSILATDLGSNNAIVTLPNITSFDELRNTIVGVDSAVSGFAFIVYDILASGGLNFDINTLTGDYHVRQIGGGALRLQSILAGNVSAVLLSGEQLIVARANGLRVLRTYADIKNPIQLSSAVSVPPNYLFVNATIIHKFLRAYYIATQYLVNPANRNQIIDLITAANVSSNPAEFYDLSTSNSYGVKADGIITTQGIYDIISLRNRYGGFDAGTLSNKKLCDLIQERNLFNLDGLYDTLPLRLAVYSLGYSFKNKDNKSCKQLGLKIESDESSAFSVVMPVTLIVTVVFALLLL